MSEQKATNVHWHDGEINRPDRAELLGHRGATYGLPGYLARARAPSPSPWSKRCIVVAFWSTALMAITSG